MKKNFLWVLLFANIPFWAEAQQDPQFSQYMFNTLAVNPAYAGNRGVLGLTGLHRQQWLGIEGAPQTSTFTFDMPIPYRNAGVGASVISDRIGVTSTFGLNLYYSYQIKFKNGSMFSMGLQGGFRNHAQDLGSVRYSADPNAIDRSFAGRLSLFVPNFGAGIFFNTKKHFYIGLSMPNLLENRLADIGQQSITGVVSNAKQSRHTFLMTGYVFEIGNDIALKPSLNFKFVKGAPMQLDLNCNIWFFNMLGGGISYRTGDSVIGMLEVMPTKNWHIGYAFDYTLTELRKYNSGSHEIMLRYELNVQKNKIITPRYF